MTEDEELQTIADAADDAVRARGWVPLRTVVLVEVLTEAGERELCTATSRDLRAQDSISLLGYGLMREQACITRDAIREDD